LVSIGDWAFSECPNLKKVTLATNESFTILSHYVQGDENPIQLRHIVETVHFNGSVISIPDGIFAGCRNLKEVTFYLGSRVERLGARCFAETSIEQIQVPDCVTQIGPEAFLGCKHLTVLTFGRNSRLNEIHDRAFVGTGVNAVIFPDKLRAIGVDAFSGCRNLTSVTFGLDSKLDIISERAFAGTGITAIFIPNSVKTVGPGTFRGCAHLKRCEGGASIKDIYEETFAETGLTRVCIPQNVEIIHKRAFAGSPVFGFTCAPGCQLRVIEDFAFGGRSNISAIEIPFFIERISPHAFSDCHVSYVVLRTEKKLQNIGFFDACNFLEISSITVGNNVKMIDNKKFEGWASLNTVTFEADSILEAIGEQAFVGTRIREIGIPSSVRGISNNAFEGCPLSRVTFGWNSRLLSIGKRAFAETLLEVVHIPFQVDLICDGAFDGCRRLRSVHFEPDRNHSLREIYPRTFAGTNIEVFCVPEYVQSIDESAFDGCVNLADISFWGRDLLRIGARAFAGTSLQRFLATNSVQKIEHQAFAECRNLNQFIFEANSQLTEIGSEAFAGTALQSIALPKSVTRIREGAFSMSALSSVTFEKGCLLRTICQNAFRHTKLEDITIPSFVTSIGSGAFYLCPLTKVTFTSKNPLYIHAQAFWGTKISSVYIPSAATFGEESFCNCRDLREFKYNAGSESIEVGCRAFANTAIQCINLWGVESILEEAFLGCTNLTQVVLHNCLKELQPRSFANTGLTAIEVPSSLNAIDEGMFLGCRNLIKVKLHEGLEKFHRGVFMNTRLKTIEIPNSVTSIASEVFAGTSLEKVTFGQNSRLLRIDERAFENCCLTSINLEDCHVLTSIGANAFARSGVVSITIPEFASVEEAAFKDCTKLKNLVFVPTSPGHKRYIGNFAFAGCTSLLGGRAQFRGTAPLYVDSYHIGKCSFQRCHSLQEIIVLSQCIGSEAFTGCTALVNATLRFQIDDGHVDHQGQMLPFFGDNVGANIPDLFDARNPQIVADGELRPCFPIVERGAFFGCAKLREVGISYTASVLPAEKRRYGVSLQNAFPGTLYLQKLPQTSPQFIYPE
jgi:hypothetical protein